MAETAAQKKARLAKAAAATEKARLAALAKQRAQAQARVQGLTFQTNKAAAKKARLAEEAAAIAADPELARILTKVGTTGKTQAQLDAAAGAADVATSIGGKVDPVTGYVIKPGLKSGVDTDGDGVVDTTGVDTVEDPADTAAANEKKDAFAEIKLTLQGYGFTKQELDELFGYIEKGLLDPRMGPNQMIIELRGLKVYKDRFAGNQIRIDKGLNALSEANYKQQEDSYAEYLTAGGVSRLGGRAMYAKLIGGAVSPEEVGKRVNLAVDRVVNSDPEIMKMIYKYNPTISQQDLVAYFLDPEATLPELEKKTTMAEIGTAAKQAGMDYGAGRIEGLTNYGINRSQAIEGYGSIGEVLPISEKLSDIYSENNINYDQTAAESEFFKRNPKATQKRERLKSFERANFEGGAGVAPGAFSTSYLKKSLAAGLI